MNLLIVESPGKIKKLKEILGKDWIVSASFGHVRDLPNREIGVEPPEFVAEYVPTEKGRETLSKLKKLVNDADEIYLATDPDREGEAIAWHLLDALNLKNPKRVSYTSITKKEVLEGIANARTIDMDFVKAQEARRVLDRFCGYMVSPALTRVLGEHFTAGRVQSPAVSLVVAREKAIKEFISTKHFGVQAMFEQMDNIKDGWFANWKSENFLASGEEYILDKELTEKIAKIKTFTVKDFIEEEKKQAPTAPFTTSSLQQESSTKLKFSPKKTMQLAQKLYENGHITYLRTDSPNLSKEAISQIQAYCTKENIPFVSTPRTWNSKENAQEAHEAIRPTHIEIEVIEGTKEEQELYELIRFKALASQLEDCVYSVRKIVLESDLDGNSVLFETQGKTILSQGWKSVYSDDSDVELEEASQVPTLKIGNTIQAISCEVQAKQTKAPTRYTQASLIRELEKQGIGRPATYASIMDNIMQRSYITEENRKLYASERGIKLIDSMQGYFSFLSLEFTKKMEDRLDDIAKGKHNYKEEVKNMFELLVKEIAEFKRKNAVLCPKCKSINFKHIFVREKGYDFFSCDDCKETFNNINGKPTERSMVKANDTVSEHKCEKCQSFLIEKPTKNGGVWFSCSSYPSCKERYWADKEGKLKFE